MDVTRREGVIRFNLTIETRVGLVNRDDWFMMLPVQVKSRSNDRIAVLLDGGFVRRVLTQARTNQILNPADVVEVCERILSHERLNCGLLYRIFYYDAMPYDGVAINPMDGFSTNYRTTALSIANHHLIDGLEQEPDFAVRRGVLLRQGWKIKQNALRHIARGGRPIQAKDLVPDFKQKGVDIRIGLDIARIALNRLVEIMVLVTGDSDFVPVMKFARTEGLKVYLVTFGKSVRPELKAHADCVLS